MTLAEINEAALVLLNEVRATKDRYAAKGFQGVPYFSRQAEEHLLRAYASLKRAQAQAQADEFLDRQMQARACAVRVIEVNSN